MSTILKNISLADLLGSTRYVLKGVTPRYQYDGDKRTDTIEGYAYKVANADTYDLFTVVVPGAKPAVTEEVLKTTNDMGEHVYVEIEDAVLTPYVSKSGSIEDSVKATVIHQVKK